MSSLTSADMEHEIESILWRLQGRTIANGYTPNHPTQELDRTQAKDNLVKLLRRFGIELIDTPMGQEPHWNLHPDETLRSEQHKKLNSLVGEE